MWLKRLVLKNFRNYKHADIEFDHGTNLILGQNAQGKTNILEAISLLSTGRSFRTRDLSDAIRCGESFFFLEVFFEKEGVEQTLSLAFDGASKKIQHNETSHQSFLSLLGILPSVFIVPEDIALIIGGPAERRKFLDMHIAQVDPLYVYHLGRYYKAMKQRNALLKQHDSMSIGSWEAIMAQAASYLVSTRQKHLQILLPYAQKIMSLLSGMQDVLFLEYKPSTPDPLHYQQLEECYVKMFFRLRSKEMIFGSTLHGPHKDDIEISIQSRLAKYFGSEGQKRSAVTSLLLAQKEVMKDHMESPPLVAIDDFGAHFDAARNKELITLTQGKGQTFLTSPLCSDEIRELSKQTLFVEAGSIRVKNSQYV